MIDQRHDFNFKLKLSSLITSTVNIFVTSGNVSQHVVNTPICFTVPIAEKLLRIEYTVSIIAMHQHTITARECLTTKPGNLDFVSCTLLKFSKSIWKLIENASFKSVIKRCVRKEWLHKCCHRDESMMNKRTCILLDIYQKASEELSSVNVTCFNNFFNISHKSHENDWEWFHTKLFLFSISCVFLCMLCMCMISLCFDFKDKAINLFLG